MSKLFPNRRLIASSMGFKGKDGLHVTLPLGQRATPKALIIAVALAQFSTEQLPAREGHGGQTP